MPPMENTLSLENSSSERKRIIWGGIDLQTNEFSNLQAYDNTDKALLLGQAFDSFNGAATKLSRYYRYLEKKSSGAG